jgi:Holliday junction resolvase RusA-like endonuclease
MLTICIPGEPIRTTEQQHRFGGIGKGGKAIVYRDARLQSAKDILLTKLAIRRPPVPLDGPVYLEVVWVFGTTNKQKREQIWKTTRPDTDNMLKLLKDCMTEAGYWHDDAQVVLERTMKAWGTPEEACTVIKVGSIDPPSEGGQP